MNNRKKRKAALNSGQEWRNLQCTQLTLNLQLKQNHKGLSSCLCSDEKGGQYSSQILKWVHTVYLLQYKLWFYVSTNPGNDKDHFKRRVSNSKKKINKNKYCLIQS